MASIFYRDLFRCKFLEYRADLYTKLEAKRLKCNEREKKVLGGDSDSADEHHKQVTQLVYVTVVLGNYLTMHWRLLTLQIILCILTDRIST